MMGGLLAMLRHWLPDHSWSQIRKLVASRRVSVNGSLCIDESRPITRDDTVTVHDQPLPPLPTVNDVRVIYCDDSLVVVEKPSGMVTLRHASERRWPRSRKALQPTLDDDLLHLARRYLPRDIARKTELLSVHRIDRDTSGLLVFALRRAVQEKLIEQFAAHDVTRVYRVVIPGQMTKQTIRSRLVRDRGDGLRGSNRDTEEGDEAVTHVSPISRLGSDYSELECRLETGRTHQIRIHLAEARHPVCGDIMYRGPMGGPSIIDKSGTPRLALHAAQLGFEHPTLGEVLHFESPWPSDMEAFIARMRSATGRARKSTKKREL